MSIRVDAAPVDGMSSGANVSVALKVAGQMDKGKNVVAILPDSRDRYFFAEHFTT